MRPFFSYFGGKWRLAPRYPAPTHGIVVEPFAGAAGYATRHWRHEVRLYDLDPIIVGLWDYIIHASEREILALPVGIAHVDEVPGPQEARWLVGFWFTAGAYAPNLRPSAWMRNPEAHGPRERQFWGPRVRERLARQASLIRHWRVELRDYRDVPTEDATWFVDPPYQRAGRRYRMGSRAIDYGHLGAWCRRLPGQVIVCENEGADWLPFAPHHVAHAMHGSVRSGESREAAWMRDADLWSCAAAAGSPRPSTGGPGATGSGGGA